MSAVIVVLSILGYGMVALLAAGASFRLDHAKHRAAMLAPSRYALAEPDYAFNAAFLGLFWPVGVWWLVFMAWTIKESRRQAELDERAVELERLRQAARRDLA